MDQYNNQAQNMCFWDQSEQGGTGSDSSSQMSGPTPPNAQWYLLGSNVMALVKWQEIFQHLLYAFREI